MLAAGPVGVLEIISLLLCFTGMSVITEDRSGVVYRVPE